MANKKPSETTEVLAQASAGIVFGCFYFLVLMLLKWTSPKTTYDFLFESVIFVTAVMMLFRILTRGFKVYIDRFAVNDLFIFLTAMFTLYVMVSRIS